MNELDQNVSRTYGYLVGGQCKLAYKSSIGEIEKEEKTIRERFFSVLTKLAKAEAERKMTLVGPHRDDVNILLAEDKSYRYFGSQGQQRSIALALRLAEAETINQVLDKKPLLLLDDIFSELDETRRKRVLSLCEDGYQIIMTSTDPLYSEQVDIRLYKVENNTVEKQ